MLSPKGGVLALANIVTVIHVPVIHVTEWLADEETVCLTNAEFRRLQEMFQFNGIPHYETITPDCRRVREDLSIGGYDNFDYELQRLLDKLK